MNFPAQAQWRGVPARCGALVQLRRLAHRHDVAAEEVEAFTARVAVAGSYAAA